MIGDAILYFLLRSKFKLPTTIAPSAVYGVHHYLSTAPDLNLDPNFDIFSQGIFKT